MEKQIEISIIIPAYNSEQFLKKCLQSVCNQDYSPEKIEVILVDNNSSDRTKEITLTYPQVKYFLACSKQSAAYARNYGAKKSSGKYLLFLDSDVELESNWVTKNLNNLKSNLFYDVAIAPIFPNKGKGYLNSFRQYRFKKINSTNGLPTQGNQAQFFINSAAMLIRKNIFEKYFFNEEFKRYEDSILSLQLTQNNHFIRGTTKTFATVFHNCSVSSYLLRYFNNGKSKFHFDANLHALFKAKRYSFFYYLNDLFRMKFFNPKYLLFQLLCDLICYLGYLLTVIKREETIKIQMPNNLKNRLSRMILINNSFRINPLVFIYAQDLTEYWCIKSLNKVFQFEKESHFNFDLIVKNKGKIQLTDEAISDLIKKELLICADN